VNFLVFCALLHCVSWFSSCCRALNFPFPPPPNSGRGIRRNAAKNRRRNLCKLRRSDLRAINRDSQGRCASSQISAVSGIPINRRFQREEPIQLLLPGTISVELCEIAFLPPRTHKPGKTHPVVRYVTVRAAPSSDDALPMGSFAACRCYEMNGLAKFPCMRRACSAPFGWLASAA
jgi:hypothetical protein